MTNPKEPESARKVSPIYQIIIIVGCIFLFVQLYTSASNLYQNKMADSIINEKKQRNEELKKSIDESKIKFYQNKILRVNIRDLKDTTKKGYLDEQVYIVKSSDSKIDSNNGNGETLNPVQLENMTLQKSSILPKTEAEILEEVQNKPSIEQWKYFFFHVTE
jgi:hypothetical protein